MYHAVGLLTPQTDFSLSEAARRLQAHLPDHQVVLEGQRITVRHQDWSIHVELEQGEHLRDEIEGLVSRLAGVEPEEADRYVASLRRLQIFSEDVDPMDGAFQHLSERDRGAQILLRNAPGGPEGTRHPLKAPLCFLQFLLPHPANRIGKG
jgi:hypothetical protein